MVRAIVATLRPPAGPPWPVIPPTTRGGPGQLYGVVSSDTRTPYDVREVIARLVDGSASWSSRPSTAPPS